MKTNVMIKGWLYRLAMKISHRYNWHYAPPIYPGGEKHLWCKWCGFREEQFRPKVSGERLRSIEETRQQSIAVPVDMSVFIRKGQP